MKTLELLLSFAMIIVIIAALRTALHALKVYRQMK